MARLKKTILYLPIFQNQRAVLVELYVRLDFTQTLTLTAELYADGMVKEICGATCAPILFNQIELICNYLQHFPEHRLLAVRLRFLVQRVS